MPANVTIEKVSRPSAAGKLNEEWIQLLNDGDAPFNAEGCSISMGRGGGAPRVVTTIQAGLVLKPGERVRMVTGSSGKTSHGEPPSDDGIPNFHLFLKAAYLDRPGGTVRLTSKVRREICRAKND